MSNIKRKYKNKFFYLTISFYLLVFSLIFVLIIYLLNEFLKRDLAFGKRIFDSTLVFFIIFLIILIIPILTILTLNEYKNYIRKQSQVSNETRDHTLDDIFENEVREKIIKIILENPGIHTNEILRDLDLAKGQLQWHLDILLSNGIIKMKKLGQYKTFYSKLNNKDLDYTKILISKSDTASNILDLIKKNPGINSKTISENLKLNRSSVKYHVDKLIKREIVSFKDAGNEKQLFFIKRK